MKYYERIRELREEKELTQRQVAEYLHIGQTTYSDYEFDISRIPVERLILLAKFYNVDMNYITGVSNHKSEFPKK